MKARSLKEKFINFFISQNHSEIYSTSLLPENDPSTLFISAGMHPLVPYLLGQAHPLGRRLTGIQKCVRTGDIEEVGDAYHHTFFEMLGNWSLGDYFKKEMIPWSYQFLTQELNINPKHLHVTCFEGDQDSPKDTQSYQLWLEQGIDKSHIHYLPKKDNWWGPAGTVGPCGPDSEMFIDTKPQIEEVDFIQGCHEGRIIEIWNDVFMQYNKDTNGKYQPLSQKNVDTGMGVERTTAILSGFSDNYLSDIWQPIIKKIEEISHKQYQNEDYTKSFRIIADHIKASVFIIADGVEPSNKEAGYVLRRLIRRAIRQAKLLGIESSFVAQVAQSVIDNQHNYAGEYEELSKNQQKIISILQSEEDKFRKTLNNGLHQITKLINSNQPISGKDAFTLYESFGFPLEMIEEELKKHNLSFDIKDFNEAKEKHSQSSKTLSSGKFKSGLANSSQTITRYHTATHLLHAALRKILGSHVQQFGSNITEQRLRFDFSHPDKLTEGEITQISSLINKLIKEDLPVTVESMPYSKAIEQNALAFFNGKYPEIVTVYTIGQEDNIFSKEVCTGPHVSRLFELGTFQIIKQESSGSGRRRLYAVLN